MFEVLDVLDKPGHEQHTILLQDITNITNEELSEFLLNNNVDFLISEGQDKELMRRAYYIIHKLNKIIPLERMRLLSEMVERPKPYDSKNLIELPINEDKLVSVKDVKLSWGGFEYNGYGYSLSPSIASSNSSYWIGMAILKFIREKNLNFKIRFDPLIEKPLSDFNPMHYLMTVYGQPLNWERLRSLKEEEYGQWLDDKSYSQIGFTDYVWRPTSEEIDFTCEEIPTAEYIDVRGSRYFHAIFEKATGLIKHCDGAIRLYNKEEYQNRLKYHVRNAEVRKVGHRIKIFQLDDTIDQNIFALC